MIDLTSLQIPGPDVVPEPTEEDWVVVLEWFESTDCCRIAEKAICSIVRRCRDLEAVVENYESVMDQTKSAARIAELEAEVARLRKERAGLMKKVWGKI